MEKLIKFNVPSYNVLPEFGLSDCKRLECSRELNPRIAPKLYFLCSRCSTQKQLFVIRLFRYDSSLHPKHLTRAVSIQLSDVFLREEV